MVLSTLLPLSPAFLGGQKFKGTKFSPLYNSKQKQKKSFIEGGRKKRGRIGGGWPKIRGSKVFSYIFE